MKVVIPLAGKGTRLRPHTYVTPKPLLRVGGRPVMSYILDQLLELDVSEIIFITGYLKEKIEAYVTAEYPAVATRFIEQQVQDGTAGAVRLAEPHIDQDVLIVFVDTLFDADLSLIRRLPPEAAGVIWVKEVEDYRRFGVVLTDADGYMRRIVEKPKEPVSRLANIGLYHIRDRKLLFQGIEHALAAPPGPGGEFYLTDALQYMIERGARILTAPVAGWYDCGKPETLLETNAHLLETGRARPPAPATGVLTHGAVRVEDRATLQEAEIGPHVSIGAGARIRTSRIRNAIIGDDAVIEDADLHDSLIGDRAIVRRTSGRLNVGADARVEGG
jgi:glucose-1-phosphate thymidylyltransferase